MTFGASQLLGLFLMTAMEAVTADYNVQKKFDQSMGEAKAMGSKMKKEMQQQVAGKLEQKYTLQTFLIAALILWAILLILKKLVWDPPRQRVVVERERPRRE